MSDRFYSVDEVAGLLGLHVRTVRNYVRDGRLPAVRIGKQYRIAADDLETFTGHPVSEEPGASPSRHAEASSVVEIDGVAAVDVHRLTTLLMTAAANRQAGDAPLRIETAHDPGRGRLKVIVLGSLGDTARLFDYMEGVLTS